MSTALTTTTHNESQIVEFSAFGNIQHFENAQRMAKALCSSSIVPTAYQGESNLGSCVIALELANRIGASVLAVMQNLFIIHGKPGWSSQFLISCVNASKKFTPLRYKMTGEKGDDSWGCIAWAQDKTGEVLESPEVTIDMAKAEGWYGRNGSKWKTMPELMLRYRTATLFARLYAPELTMGIQTAEEIADVVDVESVVVSMPPTGPSFTPKAPELSPTPRAKAKVAPVERIPEVQAEPIPQAPEPIQKPALHPPAHDTAKTEPSSEPPQVPPVGDNSGPMADLLAAMQEEQVSVEQMVGFATRKGVLKEGTDKDLAVMSDILPSKLSVLAKMVRAKGTALKEMKG